MKRIFWLVALAILLGLGVPGSASVYAGSQSGVTLNPGEVLKILPNNCTLSLNKNRPELVRIKCQATTLTAAKIKEGKEQSPAVLSQTLNPGEKLTILANQCALVLLKNTPSLIKVKCNPITVINYEWGWENPLPQGNLLIDVSCPVPTMCKAVGVYGTIVSWDGTGWSDDTSGTTAWLFDVSCASATMCKAVGGDGTIWSWNGTKWNKETSGTTNALQGVSCPSARRCKTVGQGGTILGKVSNVVNGIAQ